MSLIDYPEKICSILFTQGCNFRCPYCHNRELVDPHFYQDPIPEDKILQFLNKRQGVLQGVVITGGEPTLQKDLKRFLQQIKTFGYSIKMDTNGSQPAVLEELIKEKLIDFIAMDIKAPLYLYKKVVGINVNESLLKIIKKSINIIINSKIDYEFRTTIVDKMIGKTHILEIAKLLKGVKKYILL